VDDGEFPRLKNNVRVVYPPIARDSYLEGTVVVRATVAPDGRLSDTHVVRSVPVCDEAVLDALRRWEFVPRTIAGRPVATPVEVLAEFKR
jgi:TonB family protein